MDHTHHNHHHADHHAGYHDHAHHHMEPTSWKDYQPLGVIVGLIFVASVAAATQTAGGFNITEWMMNFMAGFFLVFAGFKLLDLKGFQEGYASYDLLAAKWPTYGLIYPFLELVLGLMYLTRWETGVANIATVLLMGFSAIGVAQSLLQKRDFQCACLGTVIQVPLSKVTLIEDVTMVVMAAAMIL